MAVIFSEDVVVRGTLVPSAVTLPDNAINSESQIKAGVNIPADKTEQRIYPSHAQPNTAATTETRTLFVARRAGVVNEVIVGSIGIAVGNAITTVDVRRNGTTILSAVVTLDSANATRIVESGAISGAGTFVAGDWYDVVITATIGTGTLPTGVFVQMECDQAGA